MSSLASLPFKLRHKAKNNNNDSDSGSDSSGNVINDITSNHSVIGSNNINLSDKNNSGNSLNDSSLLKTENFALRSELQRLATEVASLKNVLVFNPSVNSMKTIASHESLRCNSYQGESRSNTPHIAIEPNEGLSNGSSIITNGIQSQKVTNIAV
jgi:hypothetical protein